MGAHCLKEIHTDWQPGSVREYLRVSARCSFQCENRHTEAGQESSKFSCGTKQKEAVYYRDRNFLMASEVQVRSAAVEFLLHDSIVTWPKNEIGSVVLIVSSRLSSSPSSSLLIFNMPPLSTERLATHVKQQDKSDIPSMLGAATRPWSLLPWSTLMLLDRFPHFSQKSATLSHSQMTKAAM